MKQRDDYDRELLLDVLKIGVLCILIFAVAGSLFLVLG